MWSVAAIPNSPAPSGCERDPESNRREWGREAIPRTSAFQPFMGDLRVAPQRTGLRRRLSGVVVQPHLDQPAEVRPELLELVRRVGRRDGLPQDPVEVVGGHPLVDALFEVAEVLAA